MLNKVEKEWRGTSFFEYSIVSQADPATLKREDALEGKTQAQGHPEDA